MLHQIFVSICNNVVYNIIVYSFTVNVRSVVENFAFDEYDEIQYMNEQQQECDSLSDITPSHYLRVQQSGGIIFANKIPNEETKL